MYNMGNSIHIVHVWWKYRVKKSCFDSGQLYVCCRSSQQNWFQLFNLFWILCGRIFSSLHYMLRTYKHGLTYVWLYMVLFHFRLTYRNIEHWWTTKRKDEREKKKQSVWLCPLWYITVISCLSFIYRKEIQMSCLDSSYTLLQLFKNNNKPNATV